MINNNLSNFGVSNFGRFIQLADGGVHGFTCNIGYTNIIHVEVMKLYHRLRMNKELDIKNLMCYYEFNSTIKFILEYVNI